MMWLDYVLAGCSVLGLILSAVSIFFVAKALYVSKDALDISRNQLSNYQQEISKNLDQSKRETTVNVVMRWTEMMKKEYSSARKIGESLSEAQCNNLYNQKPFTVSDEIGILICEMCHVDRDRCEGCMNEKGEFLVQGYVMTELRWRIAQYLNSLEAIMIAWQQGIVNRDLIMSEFSYLVDPVQNRNVIKHYRAVAGNGKAFPAIEEFYNELVKKMQEERLIGRETPLDKQYAHV